MFSRNKSLCSSDWMSQNYKELSFIPSCARLEIFNLSLVSSHQSVLKAFHQWLLDLLLRQSCSALQHGFWKYGDIIIFCRISAAVHRGGRLFLRGVNGTTSSVIQRTEFLQSNPNQGPKLSCWSTCQWMVIGSTCQNQYDKILQWKVQSTYVLEKWEFVVN